MMSALSPKADIRQREWNVRYGPEADIATLFNHLVCAQQERGRDREADFFRGFEIEDELEFRGLLDRQIGWLSATRDPVDIHGSLTVHPDDNRPPASTHSRKANTDAARCRSGNSARSARSRNRAFACD